MTDGEKLIKLLAGKPELLKNLNTSISRLYKLADYLIANDVTLQSWTPVTERLPKCFGTFIVAITESDGTAYTDSASYNPLLKAWKTSGYFGNGYEVTHWMSLPRPPKEVD